MEGGWEGKRARFASKRIWSALISTFTDPTTQHARRSVMQFFQEQLPMRRGHKHKAQQQRHVRADVRSTPEEQLSQEQHQGQQGAQVQALSAALPACGHPRRFHSLATALSTHGDGYRTRSDVHDQRIGGNLQRGALQVRQQRGCRRHADLRGSRKGSVLFRASVPAFPSPAKARATSATLH
ncbi:hypothetical protein EDB92DRAFT_1846740 [Lactarius akahatsu]|uniref:Uncharacterized protein n=1 Tax=Lactarius akahatsu TaxID=416441 RepID=A0AAD4QCP8_9AGAM|nr:hypothetical protein EDB92DRAFT_1907558 [Lactarius akahatsu]KAH8979277.1 hypothetical protein EDB92DRAFT_1905181 [Lactarius akahatsu]KAH8979541.1 hypothetical protein EDB92DRAFT_1904037 [Lactarius akahatsu]KAH8982027.1 hypothetical protein EDB92DRAFT_1895681 [Lactarius akahatsu]KAH8982950.1 hypothetical protein EDB92DRAFT_1892203 [Lactarius akahatsu]